MKRIVLAGAAVLWAATSALGDFSYEQTSRVTGGMMAGAMKVMGALSKQARGPFKSSILVKGNRMAHITLDPSSGAPRSANIVDLDRETITEINFEKKTYYTQTFAQIAERMRQAEERLKNEKGDQMKDLSVKVDVKDTGQKRQVAGYDSQEFILTIQMEGTDEKTGRKGTFMTITSDVWITPQISGYQEIQEFYKRMMQKVTWAPSMGMAMTQPGSGKGMAEMMKEMSKMRGVPVYQTMKMGMGEMPAEAAAAPQSQPQAQAQPQQQQEQEKPSTMGRLGRLGRLGGIGGFGRKKQDEEQQQQQQAAGRSEQSGGAPGAQGVLMEMTSESSGFSTGSIDASKFEVPAGFKQVEAPSLRGER